MRLFLPHGVCAPVNMDLQPFFSAHGCGGYIRAGAVRYILEKALTHHTSVAQNLPPPPLITAPETFKRSCGRFRINKSNSTFSTNSFLTTGHLIPACLFRLFHYQTIDPPSKLAATHQQYQTSISTTGKHQHQQQKMGCMSSKAVPQEEEIINAKPMPQIVRYFDPIELQFLEIELTTTQSWPTKCYRNPGVLPATLAIGYPYPYPDGYPNTPPPFPIPNGVRGIENEKFMNCGRSHGMRRREGEPRTS